MKNFFSVGLLLIATSVLAQQPQWNTSGNNTTTGTVQANQFLIAASGGRNFVLNNSSSTNDPFKIALGGNSISSGIMIGREDWMSKVLIPWKLGLGTLTPSEQLEINGNLKFTNTSSKIFMGANDYITFDEFSNDLLNSGYKFFYNGASRMVINHYGNVGIGTTAPKAKLDVNGKAIFNDNITLKALGQNRWIITEETNTGKGSLTIQAGQGSAGFGGSIKAYAHSHNLNPGWIKANISANSNGKFAVNTYGNGLGEDVFTVDSEGNGVFDGKVGIGTTTPSSKLHLKGTSSTYSTIENTGGNSKLVFGAVSNRNIIYSRELDNSPLGFRIHVNNENDFAIRSNGNVGIGTTVASQKLEVNGKIKSKGFISTAGVSIYSPQSGQEDSRVTINNNDADLAFIYNYKESDSSFDAINIGGTHSPENGITILGDGKVGIGIASPSSKLHLKGMTSIFSTLENTGGDTKLLLGAATNRSIIASRKIDNSPQKLKFQVSNENNFVINTNGTIGVGTDSSTGPHKMVVEGSLGAREIKVQNGAWADFVFKKEYDLPTLEEVATHIKEKGHLKDIPSAKEVEKNGFYLGQMDAKLLQKIEELTLYTIEQEKQIQELKEEVKVSKQQAKEIDKLKEEVKELEELKELIKQLLKKNTK